MKQRYSKHLSAFPHPNEKEKNDEGRIYKGCGGDA